MVTYHFYDQPIKNLYQQKTVKIGYYWLKTVYFVKNLNDVKFKTQTLQKVAQNPKKKLLKRINDLLVRFFMCLHEELWPSCHINTILHMMVLWDTS